MLHLPLREAFEAAQLGITISDPGGVLLYVNPAAAAMHGYEREELVGKPSRMLGAASARRTLTVASLAEMKRWSREMLNRRKNGEAFPVLLMSDVLEDAAGHAIGIVTFCQDLSERKRREEAEMRAALRDPLTGLASRGFLLQLLERVVQRQTRRPEHRFAVLYLDLDRFAMINESLGHAAGDLLLREVAERLSASVRPTDVVARIAGDEFAALLDDIRDEADGLRVAERWVAALRRPFDVEGTELYLAARIGIALSQAGHADPERYLADASAAMQRARTEGDKHYQVFDSAVHKRSSVRLRLETALRRAVDEGQFRVAYQPIVAIGTGMLRGFEALVRWERGEGEMVPPAQFIPIAEETGLIVPLGSWVLDAACRQLADWSKRFPACADLAMNVNLSVRHLRQGGVVEQVLATLSRWGLAPGRLKLEITESMLMEHAEAQLRIVSAFREAGVGVAIDDFGTGYSSLAYLRRFRVDTLKIDRSFLSETAVEAWAIVEMIVALARSMGIAVVAEGVESEAQRRKLEGLGCDYGQGYLFGRPMDPLAAERYVAGR